MANTEPLMWNLVTVVAETINYFDPDNSNAARYKEKANFELNRPRIGKPSFATDVERNTTMVSIPVTVVQTGKTDNYWVREGEEFADGRYLLMSIIGKNQGIKVKDVQDGKTMDIMKSREREGLIKSNG